MTRGDANNALILVLHFNCYCFANRCICNIIHWNHTF